MTLVVRTGRDPASLAGAVREGGLLLVQVPDADYFLRTSQPNFMAHEHVHYFRRAQLSRRLLGGTGGATDRVAGELMAQVSAA